MSEVDLTKLAIERPQRSDDLAARRFGRPHWTARYLLPLALMAGFLVLVAWASWDLMFPRPNVTVVPVFSTTAEVRRDAVPLFQAAGWIEPRPTPIRVAALAPGVVEKLLVVEDQPVRRGDPIAELVKDDASLAWQAAQAEVELRRAELDQAQAELTAAVTRFEQPVHLQAELGEAEAELAKLRTQLKNLPFEVRRAEADLAARRRDYDGKRAAQGVVAGVQIDIAKGKVESAEALVAELRDRATSLAAEQRALTERRDALRLQCRLLTDETKAKHEAKAKVQAAVARLAKAQVVEAEAQLRLDRMTIVAPVDGRVFRLIAHPGARIGGGMFQMEGHDGSTVVTLYRPEMLQVRVDTRFEDIPKVRLGQPVEIKNPALDAPLMGTVLLISSEADIQKNTLQVKVAIPDPPQVLKPEMLVDVTFLSVAAMTEKTPESAAPEAVARILIPRRLVISVADENLVWIADRSAGVARQQRVQLGPPADDGLVEVHHGLTVTSRLIASGTEHLRDGGRIRILGEEASVGR